MALAHVLGAVLFLGVPVPVLAATGLAVPLPNLVYRMAVSVAEGTQALARAATTLSISPSRPAARLVVSARVVPTSHERAAPAADPAPALAVARIPARRHGHHARRPASAPKLLSRASAPLAAPVAAAPAPAPALVAVAAAPARPAAPPATAARPEAKPAAVSAPAAAPAPAPAPAPAADPAPAPAPAAAPAPAPDPAPAAAPAPAPAPAAPAPAPAAPAPAPAPAPSPPAVQPSGGDSHQGDQHDNGRRGHGSHD